MPLRTIHPVISESADHQPLAVEREVRSVVSVRCQLVRDRPLRSFTHGSRNHGLGLTGPQLSQAGLSPGTYGTFYRSSDHGALLPAAGLLWTPSEDGCGTVGPAGPTRVASIARSLPSVTRALLGSTHGSDSSELGSGLGKLSQRLPPLGALGLVVAGQISADAACPLGRRTRHASRITHHPSPTHAFAD